MAPALGFAACYSQLASMLGGERDIYGLDIGEETDISGIAAVLAKAIQETMSSQQETWVGPLHLGGWSVGGNICFEIASRLRKTGVQVKSIHLLDPADPAEFQLQESKEEKRIRRETALETWLKMCNAPHAAREDPVQWLVEHQGTSLGLSHASSHDVAHRIELAVGRTYTAVDGEPREVWGEEDAAVLFLRATLDDDFSTLPAGEHWRPKAKRFRVTEVHARHDDLLDPEHLEQVSAALRSHLTHSEIDPEPRHPWAGLRQLDCMFGLHQLRARLDALSLRQLGRDF